METFSLNSNYGLIRIFWSVSRYSHLIRIRINCETIVPGFRSNHRLVQKCAESMYLLDKNIMWKFGKVWKILSGQNRQVPNHLKCEIWPPSRPCPQNARLLALLSQVFSFRNSILVQGGRPTQFSQPNPETSAQSRMVPFENRSAQSKMVPFLTHLAEIWIPYIVDL